MAEGRKEREKGSLEVPVIVSMPYSLRGRIGVGFKENWHCVSGNQGADEGQHELGVAM